MWGVGWLWFLVGLEWGDVEKNKFEYVDDAISNLFFILVVGCELVLVYLFRNEGVIVVVMMMVVVVVGKRCIHGILGDRDAISH